MSEAKHNHALATQLYKGSPESEMRNAMFNAGVITDVPLIADGELHRFKTEGDKRKNGWYVLHPDHGAFGDWKTGAKECWSRGDINETDRREIQWQIKSAWVNRKKIEAEKHKQTARHAFRIWNAAHLVRAHPYLVKKNVRSHGIRHHDNHLVIPMRIGPKLWSLQRIYPDGRKLYLRGGRVKCTYFSIGQPHGRIWIVEGFATGVTVAEVTNDAVAVAFDANNLANVAGAMATKFPDQELVIAADNDATGIRHGHDAMLAGHAARMIYPDGVSDWNDYCGAHGAKKTRRKLLND